MSDEPLRLTAGDAVLGRLESILNGGRESIRQRVAEIVDEAQRQARVYALRWVLQCADDLSTPIPAITANMRETVQAEISRLEALLTKEPTDA